jgi:small-conductance mechanosensitive channel
VRATEIETFDRSSVIIPNTELISGRVKNWTLRDAVGRLKIVVIVRFSSGPERASEIMLRVGSQHPDVLQFPAPFIGFETFTADSATLSLNVFVGDVKKGGTIRTELSFSILKALQAAGIDLSMPAPVPAPVDARPARQQVAGETQSSR